MARTTPVAVQSILGRDYDRKKKPALEPYIETANSVVTQAYELAVSEGISIAAGTLELMERWMSAFYYTVSDATYTSRSNLGASGSFNKDPEGYKKVAIDLDPSGSLAEVLGQAGTVDAYWLGRPPSEQTDYVDRN
jgi:hypothetical protein